jgi:hypothetical protein
MDSRLSLPVNTVLMAGAINLWCVASGLALTVAVGPSMQTVGNIQPT